MSSLFRKYGYLLFAAIGYLFVYLAYVTPEKEAPALLIAVLQFGCSMLLHDLYGENENADEK